MNLIDTHCHLNFKAFEKDYLEVAKKSFDKGVRKIIIVGSDPTTSARAVEVAKEINQTISNFAYVAVGIHAIHTDRIDFEKIRGLALDPLVVAIGETGLDLFHDKEGLTLNKQIALFKQHIELALEIQKPLVIHNRLADDLVMGILDQYPEVKRAVLHCFSTDHNVAKWAQGRGFSLSFTGNITYGNKKIKKAIERTPIENIMVETDSPYNVPEPLRSEGVSRCEPCQVCEVIKKIALIKNMDADVVSEKVYKNSIDFFDF